MINTQTQTQRAILITRNRAVRELRRENRVLRKQLHELMRAGTYMYLEFPNKALTGPEAPVLRAWAETVERIDGNPGGVKWPTRQGC